MFFMMTQPHRGPKNESDVVRMVLFIALGPPFDLATNAGRFSDTTSIFAFEHARRKHGADSKQCLDSLRQYYKTHNPLNFYEADFPELTAYWRRQLDPKFAEWTEKRLPDLVAGISIDANSGKKRKLDSHEQDQTFVARAFQQALITDQQCRALLRVMAAG